MLGVNYPLEQFDKKILLFYDVKKAPLKDKKMKDLQDHIAAGFKDAVKSLPEGRSTTLGYILKGTDAALAASVEEFLNNQINNVVRRASFVEKAKKLFPVFELMPVENPKAFLEERFEKYNLTPEDITMLCGKEEIPPRASPPSLPKKVYFASFKKEEQTQLKRRSADVLEEYKLSHLVEYPLNYLLAVFKINEEWNNEIFKELYVFLSTNNNKPPSMIRIFMYNHMDPTTLVLVEVSHGDNVFGDPKFSFHKKTEESLTFDTNVLNLLV
jgi:hypothetical protein